MNWNFKNFSRSEFVCKHCGEFPEVVEQHYYYLVMYLLQPFRYFIGKKIIITSGYRCRPHNKNEGGKVKSYHTIPYGSTIYHPCAIDFYIPGLLWYQAGAMAENYFDLEQMGYHIYGRPDGTWLCHIDFRGYKARW